MSSAPGPCPTSLRQGDRGLTGEARLLSELEASAIGAIPEYMARLYRVVPLRVRDGILHLAASGIHSGLGRLVKDTTGLEVRWILVPAQDIGDELLARWHGRALERGEDARFMMAWAPSTLDALLAGAARAGASDVHMEPGPGSALFRYRIDGSLVDVGSVSISDYRWLVNRIKILAGMSVVEHQAPQDGRAVINTRDGAVTVRATVIPTVEGERVACRLIDRGKGLLPLEGLGLEPHVLRCFWKFVMSRLPGLTVIAGPTGSGKTTTLYSALLGMGGTTNVVTMEEPVEWRLPRATQLEIQPGRGWTFRAGLSAALRLDPDVLVIGEVRCDESAKATLEAASTGHRVLCSLHAPDALSALRRLAEYGDQGRSVVSMVNCVLAQRLVKRICPRCAQPAPLGREEQECLKRLGGRRVTTAFRGKGCSHCSGTGYRGRSGVFEFFAPTAGAGPALEQVGVEGPALALGRAGHWSLGADMVSKVEQGITTVEEVMGIARWACVGWNDRTHEEGAEA